MKPQKSLEYQDSSLEPEPPYEKPKRQFSVSKKKKKERSLIYDDTH
ncbi:14726_t:CDS:2 [Acaulospora colombiana]|uniref:14726_t:CDS:1 n=1 Tax=Acaulospora colombiana TaxID=27376 RepID=A0ACA9L5P2_9GLOM|nr:14726_t:CDS:2 [Acaulospora colombiana]